MRAPSILAVGLPALLCCAALTAFSLLPPTFRKVYGESGFNQANAILSTKSGGFLVAGKTASYSSGDVNLYALLLDESGNALWKKSFGGEGNEEAADAIQTADGGFVIVGHSDSFTTAQPKLNDMWAVKVDAQGREVWNKSYGAEGAIEEARAIAASPDGGFLIVGKAFQVTPNVINDDFLLVKIDKAGALQWQKRIGGPKADAAYDVVAVDGGYVLVGSTESYGAGALDIWLVGVDAQGEKQWEKTYGGYDNEMGNSIVACKGGGFLVGGYTYTEEMLVQPGNSMDAWVLRVGAQGEEQWKKSFGSYSTEEAMGVIQGRDGSFVAAGYAEVFQPADPEAGDFRNLSQDGHNVWMAKISAKGETAWEKTIGGKGEQRAFALTEAKDGNYAIAGFTDNEKTIKFVEKDAEGNDVEREKKVKAVDVLVMKVTRDGSY